jgi:hypothetical protein
VNYARRQQYCRLSHAGEAGLGSVIAALFGLVMASAGAPAIRGRLLLSAPCLQPNRVQLAIRPVLLLAEEEVFARGGLDAPENVCCGSVEGSDLTIRTSRIGGMRMHFAAAVRCWTV